MAILAKWILGLALILGGVGFAVLIVGANMMSDGDHDPKAGLQLAGCGGAVALGLAFLLL